MSMKVESPEVKKFDAKMGKMRKRAIIKDVSDDKINSSPK
eukprot:CAMPEP_0196200534 /NCGR_PEP_ID=MMETSP0912-20130531/3800_1 /TAXON_ID=49265 /ORGANISM="Thalassiosira rotula, Strain GSO102" /LENGTH=39 /DNA_ID= /DNA_START= /DNA_END= /DNA_ORIENTATION=